MPTFNLFAYPNVGPYTGVVRDEIRTFANGRSFRILLYCAFNALGLIGSEYNGIAILDEDCMRVVLDNHYRQSSGYYGPDQAQRDEFDRLMAIPWDEFVPFVNSHATRRHQYSTGGVILSKN